MWIYLTTTSSLEKLGKIAPCEPRLTDPTYFRRVDAGMDDRCFIALVDGGGEETDDRPDSGRVAELFMILLLGAVEVEEAERGGVDEMVLLLF